MSRRKRQDKNVRTVEPLRKAPREFNPLKPRNLARVIALALSEEPALALPPESFDGSGIYALYYRGAFEPYAPISGSETPIYVGKGVPKGARKGGVGLDDDDAPPGRALFDRVRKHARSIAAVENLRLEDFTYRALVIDPFYAVVSESLLIQRWTPIWNRVVTGFGNNPTGKRRFGQNRSLWDTLHPGRPYAVPLSPHPMDADAARDLLRRFFEGKVEPVEVDTAEEEDESE